MATLAARLANNGIYYVTGRLDEYSNNNVAKVSLQSNGTLIISNTGYLDEVSSNTTTFNSTGANNTVVKLYSNGVLAITNTAYFDEVTYVPSSVYFSVNSNASSNTVIYNSSTSQISQANVTTCTIEAWVYIDQSTGQPQWPIISTAPSTVAGVGKAGGFEITMNSGGSNNLMPGSFEFTNYLNNGFAAAMVTHFNGTRISGNTWSHIAFVRNGPLGTASSYNFYLNGNSIARNGFSIGTGTGGQSQDTNFIAIGKSIEGNTFQGYIGGIRITNNAVYTANFTPDFATSMANTANTMFLFIPTAADTKGVSDRSFYGRTLIFTNTVFNSYATGFAPANAAAVFI